MKTLYLQAEETIGSWIAACSGKAVTLRLSKKAMLATSDFLREDPFSSAQMLTQAKHECSFMGIMPVRSVRSENGWLLIDLKTDFFDAFSFLLPDSFEHGNDYVDKRMEIFLRHGDRPFPSYDPVLKAVLSASYASTRGKWTPEDEKAVLTMTHSLSGMERIHTEHALYRAAKIILYERRSLL